MKQPGLDIELLAQLQNVLLLLQWALPRLVPGSLASPELELRDRIIMYKRCAL